MKSFLSILFISVGLGFFIQSHANPAHQVIYSRDFGLSNSNTPAQNGDAFERICQYASAHKGTVIEIEKGIYRIKRETSHQIYFKDCTDITVNGNGAEFIFSETETKQSGQFFLLENVKNFKLRNLKIDWDWDSSPLSVIGQIEDINKEGIFYKLLHGGIKTLPQIHMGREWDIETNSRSLNGFALYTGYALEAQKIDNEHLYIKMKNPERLKRSDIGKYTHIRFYHNYFAGGVYVTGSENVSIEDITIYSIPETAFSCYATTNFKISGCSVVPRLGLNRFYTSHSAGEIHNSFGKIVYENNKIFYSYDDGLHISSGYIPPYMERYDNNPKKVNCQYLQYYFQKDVIRIGDTMEFYDANFKATGFKVKLMNADWRHDVRKHAAPSDCVLTFDRAVPDSLINGHYLFNTVLTEVSYEISNNEFAYNGCHGIHSGLPNGVIKGNRFYRTGYPPVNMTLVLRWGRWVIGPSPSNVKIQNNYIDECDMAKRQPACLFVGAGIDPQNGTFTPVNNTAAVRNVEITGNVIKNSDMPAIGVWSISGVVIKDNVFENVARNPVAALKSKGSVFVEYAENVIIENNTLIQPEDLKEKDLVIDPATTKGIVVKKWFKEIK